MFGYVLTNVEFQTADYQYYGYNYYDESGKTLKEPLKEKALNYLREAGKYLTVLEERFNVWWETKREERNSKQDAGDRKQ